MLGVKLQKNVLPLYFVNLLVLLDYFGRLGHDILRDASFIYVLCIRIPKKQQLTSLYLENCYYKVT